MPKPPMIPVVPGKSVPDQMTFIASWLNRLMVTIGELSARVNDLEERLEALERRP